jgi:Lipase (class 3)
LRKKSYNMASTALVESLGVGQDQYTLLQYFEADAMSVAGVAFDKDMALHMNLFSVLAYLNADEAVATASAAFGIDMSERMSFYSELGAQCTLVQVGDDVLVCAMRGTEFPDASSLFSAQFFVDWYSNLDCKLVEVDGFAGVDGRVHHGWANAVAALLNAGARKRIATFASGGAGRRVFLTGHSQGAALAMLTGAMLLGSQGDDAVRTAITSIYGIGSPKVGDQTFVDELNGLLGDRVGAFRITNHGDPVPYFPPFDGYVLGPGQHHVLRDRMPTSYGVIDHDKTDAYLDDPALPLSATLDALTFWQKLWFFKSFASWYGRKELSAPLTLIIGDHLPGGLFLANASLPAPFGGVTFRGGGPGYLVTLWGRRKPRN